MKKILLLNGVHREWGARPIRRIIQDDIENTISYKYLTGELTENSIIFITGKVNELIFRSKPRNPIPKKNIPKKVTNT